MACMEHECLDCGWFGMDNTTVRFCPECGSPHVTNIFDEEPDFDWLAESDF